MAEKFEFLFILPDGPNATENRKHTTDPHEDFVGQTQEHWIAGGAMFKEHKAGVPGQFAGSYVILQASTQEEAYELLQRDPFTTGQVWDWSRAQIFCIKSGLRVPFVKESVRKALDRAKS